MSLMALSASMGDLVSSIPFLLSLCVIGLTALAVAVYWRRRTAQRGNTVLLLGLSDAGKTLMFLQLRDATRKATQTSMSDNDDTFLLHPSLLPSSASRQEARGAVRVIDVAGHARLRARAAYWLSQLHSELAAVVFVVDADHFEPQPVARYLYDVLTTPRLGRPVLIACNKHDRLSAQSPDSIRLALERELEQERQTRQAVPEDQTAGGAGGSEDQSAREPLGLDGQRFEFAHSPVPVEFAACSAERAAAAAGHTLQPVVDFIVRNTRGSSS